MVSSQTFRLTSSERTIPNFINWIDEIIQFAGFLGWLPELQSHKMTDLYVFLLFLSCIGSTVHGQSLRIYRNKNDPDDDIQLPSVQSECPTTETPLCDKYNARRFDVSDSCLCQCNQPSGSYTFFEPNNSCIRVSEARQQAGKNCFCFCLPYLWSDRSLKIDVNY